MENNQFNSFISKLGKDALEQIQVRKLQMMLEQMLTTNEFYRRKLGSVGVKQPGDIATLKDHRQLPFTTKSELSIDQKEHPPYGTNLTFKRDQYIRIHQTSGTTGEPLRWLDTEKSWDWWGRCWGEVYRGAGVTALDRIFFAFSFGPFIGFWSAHEGARLIGALAFPGGGLSSEQRVQTILVNDISVLICTPTYALHLAEVAREAGLDIANSNVRITIHAGEPGANIPATKRRIEEAWGARCYDHAGATEVGAWGFECQQQAGLHLNESEFICEVIDPLTGKAEHEGELVITNLGRIGMPVVRYRTGDRVKLLEGECGCGRSYRRLEGGVIGRVDDALIIRGVNVFPSSIEEIVRRVPVIDEFDVTVFREGELDEMEIRVEVNGQEPETLAAHVSKEIRNALGLRARVRPVPRGTLPRYELKAARFSDRRGNKNAGEPA